MRLGIRLLGGKVHPKPAFARPSQPRRSLSGAPATALDATADVASAAPLGLVEQMLVHVHSAAGLPWWVAIGGSAVALRVAILPTVLYQVRQTRNFVALRPRFVALRNECASIEAPALRARALLGGMWRVCRAAGVQPLGIVALPLVQFPLLLGLIYSVRRMLLPQSPLAAEMRDGGAWWFRDLTTADATGALPLLSLAVLLANLQLLGRNSSGSIVLGLRNVFQAGSVVMLPLCAELPSGVFMYWIPNSAFSFVQSAVIHRMRPAWAAPAIASRDAATAAPALRATTLASPAAGEDMGPSKTQSQPAASPEQAAEVASLQQRLELAPDDVEAHVLLSKLFLRRGRPDEAVAHLWPAVRRAPQTESGPLRFQLALALALLNKHDVAEPLLEQVLQLEPGFVEALLALCNCQAALGKTEGAVQSLEQVARLRPEMREYCDREISQLRECGS